MLSILLPVNGHSVYFAPTVSSVSRASSFFGQQTELVIVLNQVSEFEKKQIENDLQLYPYATKIFTSEADNLAQVLNEGLKECSFEFVARMDQDDICHETRFRSQWEYMEKNSGVALVGGQVMLIDPDGFGIGRANYPTRPKILSKRLTSGNCFAHPAVMFRKSAVLEKGGYRNNFPIAEDYDLWVRLNKDWSLSNLSSYVLDYRIHPTQISSSSFNLQLCSTIEIIANQLNLLSPKLINQLNPFKGNSDDKIVRQILRIPFLTNHKKLLGRVALMILRRGSKYTKHTFFFDFHLLGIAIVFNPLETILTLVGALRNRLFKS